jgi:hypothetical protein
LGFCFYLELNFRYFLEDEEKHLKQLNKRMSTEIATGGNFDVTNIVVGAPVKSTDSNKYHSFPIRYKAGQFGVMETQTVMATRLKDDKEKKPNILSQGFHLENKATKDLLEAADEAIWAGLLKHKGADPDLPNFLKDAESVADLKAAGKFIKMRGLVHYPKAKDAKGNMTKEIDPKITPLVYGKLIQCGAKHKDTPFKVFSKYYDAAILNSTVKRAIKEGTDKVENYLIKAEDLWKKNLAFKAKWCMVVGDVYVSDTVLKIRRSITEVWVVSFVANETVASKAMAAAMETTGETFAAVRLTIPEAQKVGDNDSDGEGHDGPPDDVVQNNIKPTVIKSSEGGKFDVKINE